MKRPVGRPRSSDRVRIEISLEQSVIDNMRAIALLSGFITKQGRSKGEPSISAWLNNLFSPEIDKPDHE